MLKPVLAIVHGTNSEPGALGRALVARGFAIDKRCPKEGDALPDTMDDHAAAILFGGPMSANDNDDYVRRETDWVGVALESKKPFLGICLGAQILAKHLGADVHPHTEGHVEAGYYTIHAEGAGLDLFPPSLHVYHWHQEGFEMPTGATPLARGAGDFPHQAFRVSAAAYGFQFHPEMTLGLIRKWVKAGRARLEQPGARAAHRHMSDHLLRARAFAGWRARFLDMWLAS